MPPIESIKPNRNQMKYREVFPDFELTESDLQLYQQKLDEKKQEKKRIKLRMRRRKKRTALRVRELAQQLQTAGELKNQIPVSGTTEQPSAISQ
jgi:hypothetical protein